MWVSTCAAVSRNLHSRQQRTYESKSVSTTLDKRSSDCQQHTWWPARISAPASVTRDPFRISSRITVTPSHRVCAIRGRTTAGQQVEDPAFIGIAVMADRNRSQTPPFMAFLLDHAHHNGYEADFEGDISFHKKLREIMGRRLFSRNLYVHIPHGLPWLPHSLL